MMHIGFLAEAPPRRNSAALYALICLFVCQMAAAAAPRWRYAAITLYAYCAAPRARFARFLRLFIRADAIFAAACAAATRAYTRIIIFHFTVKECLRVRAIWPLKEVQIIARVMRCAAFIMAAEWPMRSAMR